MKKEISLAQLIGFTVTLLGIVIGFYVNVQVRLNNLELRMNQTESVINKFDGKLDKMLLDIYDIKIELQKHLDTKK